MYFHKKNGILPDSPSTYEIKKNNAYLVLLTFFRWKDLKKT